MPLAIPVNHAQVLIPLQHANHARPAAITFGVSTPDLTFPTVEACDDILDAFLQGISPDTQVRCGPAVMRIQDADWNTASIEGSLVRQGNAPLPAVSPNMAVIYKKTTDALGRRGRGRFFMPWGISRELVAENGQLDAGWLADAQVAAQATLAALTTAGYPMVLLHNTPVGTPIVAPSLVRGLIPDPVIGTQRRRVR